MTSCSDAPLQRKPDESSCVQEAHDEQHLKLSPLEGKLRANEHQAQHNQNIKGAEFRADPLKAKQQLPAAILGVPYLCLPEVPVCHGVHTAHTL
jgi:hypothetical protein